MKFNKVKCILVKSEVNYVGYLLIGEGLKFIFEWVSVIREIREFENYVELEMIFGMFVYVVKFILNFSELDVLFRVFKINDEWKWIFEVK